ncbi:MAG: CBS domain-containing protein [Proteobacteria bacterium]|nr:CBS domain-containing protein [Pseudomonadota bacterium]
MPILVEKLIKRGCFSIQVNSSIAAAILIMTEKKIGALPILNFSNTVVGIISERDIVNQINNDQIDFKSASVTSIMSSPVIAGNANSRAADIMAIMTEKKIRHLPILDKTNLIGMVSIGDVLKYLLTNYKLELEELRNYINS